MLKKLLSFFSAFIFATLPTLAQVGEFQRNGTSSITSPVVNNTFLRDTSDGVDKVYAPNGWQPKGFAASNWFATTNPTITNDSTQGYEIGSLWYNSTTGEFWLCNSPSSGAASWSQITSKANPQINQLLQYADILGDYKLSGFASVVPGSSLTLVTPAGIAYAAGTRIIAPSNSYTYTATADTFDFLQANGTITHSAQTVGGSAPTGIPGLLLQKVRTNASAITAITALAPSYPTVLCGTATAGTNDAIPINQADARYASIGVSNTSQAANYFYASPIGASGTPSFRGMVNADLPVVSIAKGGLGAATSATNLGVLYGNGTNYIQSTVPTVGGQVYTYNSGTGVLDWEAPILGSLASGNSLITVALTSGVGTVGLANMAPNTFIAGPASGSTAGAPTARTLVAADLPSTAAGVYQQGRLYLVSGSPFADGSSSGNSTLYFGPSPNAGNLITIENSSTTTLATQSFSQASYTITGLTTGSVYDVYVSSASSTTVTLSTAVWSSPTTPPTRGVDVAGRSTANGNVAALWVGSFVATSATTTQDWTGARLVSNVYNVYPKALIAIYTSSWTYTSSTVREIAGLSTNGASRVQVLVTVPQPITLSNVQSGAVSGVSFNYNFSIGMDQNTANSSSCPSGLYQSASGSDNFCQSTASTFVPSVGSHYFARIEWCGGSGQTATLPSGTASSPANILSGEISN